MKLSQKLYLVKKKKSYNKTSQRLPIQYFIYKIYIQSSPVLINIDP